jgi:ABC-2 type transport system permease protein
MMFVMPVILVVVIASVQNSTFELVNENKINLLICNRDTAGQGAELVRLLDKSGMFRLDSVNGKSDDGQVRSSMKKKNALVALIIPVDFSAITSARAQNISHQALKGLSVGEDTAAEMPIRQDTLVYFYHPVLQPSFRLSVEGTVRNALQIVQNQQIVRSLYFTLHEKEINDTLQNEIVKNTIPIQSVPVSRDGARTIPNASQHNVPAWTIFAMFFIVISLGGSLVREKRSGSFLRLKTLPTSFRVAIFSKMITYVAVTFLQAIVIFSIGIWLFPLFGLPRLELPADLAGLLLVTLLCGCCAASFAICIGVYAETQEQANGFGAASIVILAALGGLLVPSFAMPSSFRPLMQISPLHWCLEAYYGLFLEGGRIRDIISNILSLVLITVLFQVIALTGLKRKNLI